VLVAALVNFLLGGLWYSPMLFAKKWMALLNITEEDIKKRGSAGKAYASAIIGALVMAYVLAHIVGYANATTVGAGAQSGFWCWLGFVATTGIANTMFESRPLGLYFINTGYYLVSLIIMGVILAVWR
jgi:hypothetical protein